MSKSKSNIKIQEYVDLGDDIYLAIVRKESKRGFKVKVKDIDTLENEASRGFDKGYYVKSLDHGNGIDVTFHDGRELNLSYADAAELMFLLSRQNNLCDTKDLVKGASVLRYKIEYGAL